MGGAGLVPRTGRCLCGLPFQKQSSWPRVHVANSGNCGLGVVVQPNFCDAGAGLRLRRPV